MDAELPLPLPSPPFRPHLRLAHRSATIAGGRGHLRHLRDWEIVLVTRGRMWWWAEELDRGCWQRAGEAALIPPGFVHAYGFERSEHLAVHFDLDARPELRHPEQIEVLGEARLQPRRDEPWWYAAPAGTVLPAVRALDDAPRFERRLAELVAIAAAEQEAPGVAGVCRVGALLLDCVGELLTAPGTAEAGDRRILECLARTPATANPPVTQLARDCGLSENAFRRAFRATTGESPHRHFERRRVAAALELLRETDLGVAEVAETVGYPDPYHFSRVVKRVTGKAPSAWR